MKRGTEILRERLVGHGKQAALIVRFNDGYDGKRVDAPMVSRWVSGHSLPSREHMARLEDVEGIPMRAWAEEVADGAA